MNTDKEAQSEMTIREASVPTPSEIQFDSAHAIKKADAIVKAMDAVIKLSLQRTNEHDWVRMGKGYYLMESGAMKVRPIFGIYIRNTTISKELREDGSVAFTAQCEIGSTVLDKWYGTESTIEQIGTRCSSDKFFGANPDIEDVKKAALANCRGRGIVALLGIQNMTAEDLEKNGIKIDKIAGVEFKTGAQGGATATGDEKETQAKLYALMCKHFGTNDEKALSKYLEELTAFVGKEGKKVPGVAHLKSLTGKRLIVTYGKMKELAASGEQVIVDAFPDEPGMGG